MKDYNIRQMQRLALKYFPYDDGLLGHIARATGEVIATKTGINFIDCCIKFLILSERNGIVLSVEEARSLCLSKAINSGHEGAVLLGMLSQIFVLSIGECDLGLRTEGLRGPCQRFFNALFAMAAKRKIDLVKIVDKKLSIYDSTK